MLSSFFSPKLMLRGDSCVLFSIADHKHTYHQKEILVTKHKDIAPQKKKKTASSFYMRAAVTAIASHRRLLLPVLQSFQTSITTNRNRTIVRNIMSEMDPTSFARPRLVTKKVLAKHQREGDGAIVRRCIGRSELKSLDPFLMMDDFSVSPPAGFPDHPHRGFETVTYMTQGGITHQDFAGHKGTIHTGDVQWMTAGKGIIHSEMPAGEGVHKGLQLWINLSSQDKMIEPRYQELLSEDIPSAEQDGAEVRVIAGESMGVRSPVYTRTPTMYLDFSLRPRAQVHQHVPESWNAFAYIVEGEGVFGYQNKTPISANHVLVLGPGDGVSVWNKSSKPLRFVLIAGQPLNEPVVQYGPFVMNTQAEIDQTIEDYHYSKNGFEMAKHWRSH
ncbi:RmlC-like cupins superfamily protein [Theobroma cacao]|uniref:RmlC-like cupins superfamily protein n=1 Tax=Theobroma cacao TaxID=3641 RepID=A0A061ERH3_THECC|nr:RmlC-like cupins superfamily protein [Theobroma cacao]